MAVELAIDYNTGDLLVAPNSGIEIRTGQASVDQRIRVRLRIFAGEWLLDPTQGQLGSHLKSASRMPMWRAQEQVPHMVREALQPMEDVQVHDVICTENPDHPNTLDLLITYSMVEVDNVTGDILTINLAIEG